MLPWLLGMTLALPALPSDAQELPSVQAQTGAAAAAETEPGSQDVGAGRAFLRDVARDYRNFLSLENAEWAEVGGVVALAFYKQDQRLRQAPDQIDLRAPNPGSAYGNLAFQFPLAVTWWIAGHAADSTRGAEAGRDLLRAQISALSWTYAIKYSVNRTRPNGDPRSFPSGHTSATFATAMVLQEHYGWKLSVPIFAAAAYTGVERVRDDKHWASDVACGALVGILAGRTVTLHVRRQRVAIQPMAVPGGGGVTIHVLQ